MNPPEFFRDDDEDEGQRYGEQQARHRIGRKSYRDFGEAIQLSVCPLRSVASVSKGGRDLAFALGEKREIGNWLTV
jgi:hypothetical protein